MNKLSTTTFFFSVLALGGCAGGMEGMKHATHPDVTFPDDVAKMEAANDWDGVKKVCGTTSAKIDRVAEKKACVDLDLHFTKVVIDASCADKQKTYEANKKYLDAGYKRNTVYGQRSPERDTMSEGLLACKDASDFFVMHSPGDILIHLLRDKQNADVLPAVTHVVETPELVSKLDGVSANFFLTFVADGSARAHVAPPCQEVVSAFSSADPTTIAGATTYFGATKCTAAESLITSALVVDSAHYRMLACTALGDVGSAASMDKINIIAASDAAFETDGLVKTYFVRDACKQAAGKIAFRSGKAPTPATTKKAKSAK